MAGVTPAGSVYPAAAASGGGLRGLRSCELALPGRARGNRSSENQLPKAVYLASD